MKRLVSVALWLGPLLACGSPPPPDSRREVVEAEPPVTRLTSGRGGEERDPEVSLDGRLLVYATNEHGGDFDLFLRAAGSNTSVRLTRLDGDERFPKIHPKNPRRIAFCSNSRGSWEICLLPDIEADPARVQVVSESGADSLHPSWSPDGRHLVYCASDGPDDAGWVLKVWDAETGRTRVLEGVDGLLPEWSPRDNRIVFQRMRGRDGWDAGLWTLEYDLGTARNLTPLFSGEGWAAINPSWSPDARHVVFATVAKSRARAAVFDEPDDLWAVRDDGSHPTRLTTSSASDGMPAWASDGRIYFVSDRDGGRRRLWSLEARLPE